MSLPSVGSRSLRLSHLVNSISSSVTFQRLCGVNSAGLAAGNCYEDLSLDDGTEPFPRAVVRHQGVFVANRSGTDSFLAVGQMCCFIQYLQFTDDQLASWYSLAGPFTVHDRRRHMNNLFGQIADELRPLSVTAGCLEFQRLEEFSCGELDPVQENGANLVELTFVFHLEGSP